MLVKTITYEDYNGVSRTENFLFHLSKGELMEMELGTTGGFAEKLKRIVEAQDAPAIMREIKGLILGSYGVKSPDGKRFIKSPELSQEFSQTEAYSQLFMELVTDDEAAAAFVKGIMPAQVQKELPSATGSNP